MPDQTFAPDWQTQPETREAQGLRLETAPAGGVFLVAARTGALLPPLSGLAWPTAPGPWVGGDPGMTLIAPNRWLVACAPAHRGAVGAQLVALQAGQLVHAHDVGDGRVWFAVSGPRADALLNCGIAIDLALDRFPPGTAASVQLSRAHVLLHRSGAHAFRLLADASYTSYLRAWFAHTMPLVAGAPT